MESQEILQTAIAALFTDYDVIVTTGKDLEGIIATEKGRNVIFINFDAISIDNNYENNGFDFIKEDYRIYFLNMESVIADARQLLTYFKSSPTLSGTDTITVVVGSGFFDNNYSQAIYTQQLSLLY